MSHPARRVKVYQLNASGDWDDLGTGYVECKALPGFDGPCIVVSSETEPEKHILEAKIPKDDIFVKQQDTLIVWNDGEENEDGNDFALSFQEASACTDVWEDIADIQSRLKSRPGVLTRSVTVDPNRERIVLPIASLSNITDIVEVFSNAMSNATRRGQLSDLILKQQYLPKLVDLYKVIADIESASDYPKIYSIFRDLVLLGNSSLIEELVSPKVFIHLVGALEHDPEVQPGQLNHVEFIQKIVSFKEVLPFPEEPITELVHVNFRLQYLRDVAIAKVMDEGVNATLTGMIYVNNVKVVTTLISHEKWVTALLEKLKDPSTPEEALVDAMKLLSEMTDISRNLEPKNRSMFHSILQKNGFFSVLETTLSRKNEKIRLTSVELILNAIDTDPTPVRQYILSQSPDHPFMHLLIERLHTDENSGVKHLTNDIILRLLEIPIGVEQPPELERIIDLFYIKFAEEFFAPLVEESKPRRYYSDSEALLLIILADLLSSFLSKHGVLARGFLLEKSFLKRTFHLFLCRNKFLHLLPIRILRASLAQNSQLLTSYVITENLLEPIVVKFLENGPKYNLFNSAVIELFAFICKDNQRPMMKYYMDQFHERLKDVDYVDTFLEIKHKWESLERSTDASREQYMKKLTEEDEEERWLSSGEATAPPPLSSDVVAENTQDQSHSPPPAPPTTSLSIDAIEGDLFPSLLSDLETRKRRREEEQEEDFFDQFRKKPRTQEKK